MLFQNQGGHTPLRRTAWRFYFYGCSVEKFLDFEKWTNLVWNSEAVCCILQKVKNRLIRLLVSKDETPADDRFRP